MTSRNLSCWRSLMCMAGCIVVVLLLGASLASAQSTGAISGRIVDSTGAVIPGATVTTTNQETGRVQTTESSDGGYYNIVLPAGIYQVRAEAASFRPEIQKDLNLAVAQDAVANFTLTIGSVQEAVTVTATAPLVVTTTGSLGGLVNEQKIADLPLNGRNFNDLVLLQPGVGYTKTTSTASAARGMFFSNNGSPVSSNFMMMDGANLMSIGGYNGVSYSGSQLGVEGIREFQVITNFMPAEYGMVMGAQVVIVSKGGTNKFHGSAFEFLRNSDVDARNFFDRKILPTDPRLPAYRRNDFGGSLGGPIRKDKAFFFATYEGIRSTQGLTQVLNTPTAAARQNGFFPGVNVAPSVQPYLALFPLPTGPLANDPTGKSGVGAYIYPYFQIIREDYGSTRYDQTFSERNSFFVRYTVDDTALGKPAGFPSFSDAYSSRGTYITASETHTFTPQLLSLLRVSYSRDYELIVPSVTGPATNPALAFDPTTTLINNFSPGAFATLGNLAPGSGITALGPSNTTPRATQQEIYTPSEDLFLSHGNHSLKFGTLINHYRQFGQAESFSRGAYTFSNLQQFLSGIPLSFQIVTPGADTAATFQWYTLGFYGQDDWHVTPRLTLNVGLRYEFHTAADETTGHGASLRDIIHDATPTLGSTMFINQSLRNFSPRLGFGWDVFGDSTTSLRGGFGLLYMLGGWGPIMVNSNDTRPPFSSRSLVTSNLAFPITTIPAGTAVQAISQLDYHLGQPHLLQYNLTLDRKLPGAMALTVSYAGSRGIDLFNVSEGNPTLPTSVIGGRDFWTGLEPRMNPNWGFIDYRSTSSSSRYNSLQVSVQKGLSRGLQFQSSFTYSRSMDDGAIQMSGGEAGGGGTYGVDPNNKRLDWSPSDFNHPLVWSFNLLDQLPSNHKGIARILNGWRPGTITRLQSGQPFTVLLSGNHSRSQVQGSAEQDRPDLIVGRNPGNITSGTSAGCAGVPAGAQLGGPNLYFDPCAFTIQPFGFLGTAPRDLLTGPFQVDVDVSIARTFPLHHLGEGTALEFRTEIFNILNHANFWIPIAGATVFTADQTKTSTSALATAGQITQTLSSSRQLQFALKLVF